MASAAKVRESQREKPNISAQVSDCEYLVDINLQECLKRQVVLSVHKDVAENDPFNKIRNLNKDPGT